MDDRYDDKKLNDVKDVPVTVNTLWDACLEDTLS